MNTNTVKRGDVYYIHRYDTLGSEQRTGRPAVIVSNDKANESSTVYEVCFLTLQEKTPLPTHVTIHQGTCKNSTILCEQITTITEERLGDMMCTLPENVMTQVNKALLVSLGLSHETTVNSSSDNLIAENNRLREKAGMFETMYNNLLDKLVSR